MPRLREVRRDETDNRFVHAMYDLIFGRGVEPTDDGVATDTGSPGDWWTTHALVPDVLEHAVNGFVLYRSPDRKLDPVLRELAQARVGWAVGSQFVYSQHVRSLQGLGVDDDRIRDLPAWPASEAYSRVERAVLGYTDALALDHGRVSDELFAVLSEELADEEILELTYITSMYLMHGVIARALRLEFDDRDEPVVPVEPPEDFDATAFIRMGSEPRPD
jgi:alkylhydroperoxidase family enzyme